MNNHVVFLRSVPLPHPVDGLISLMPVLCEHCGTKIHLAMPIAINELVAVTNSFVDKHKDCPKDP